ncbi:MAG: peptide chain release factor N(5)-glutamine methyltransferase [Holosporaceae bacterium]|jgi:release factor glutamine methyltransferase|nr:peptide chain release factor N(5)-glutamine methyltransferase [Holosporaceae bacterium]
MIAKIKGLFREEVTFNLKDIYLSDAEETLFFSMLNRRKENEPLSKILNEKSFWNHDFFVNADVLDPRPETELIIEMILSRFQRQSTLNFLDIGTGSGCILLSLLSEYKNSRGIGIDISANAIEVACYNQKKIGVTTANFFVADWNEFEKEEQFDVVASNPPYISTDDILQLDENVRNYDPPVALDGGPSGLDAYISITPLLKRWLNPQGLVFFEIGYGQVADVVQILQSNGFQIDEIKKDLNNIDRIVVAQLAL